MTEQPYDKSFETFEAWLDNDRAVRARKRRRWLIAIIAVIVFLLVVAGLGYASLISSGSGTGSASTGTVDSITLDDGTVASELYPGGSADVAITVTNPNSISVHVPSLELDAGGITSDHPGCGTSALHYTTQNNAGSGYTIPVGTSSLDLSGAISMDTTADSACQGATFKVFLKVGS